MTTYDIPLFDLYEYYGNLLNTNIVDPKSSVRQGKWIFPDFPNSDSNLPQITIKYDSIEYENDSAGDILKEELDGTIYKEYYYRKASTSMYFYTLTPKNDEWKVTVDGIDRIFKNKLYNIYLTNLVKNVLLTKRGESFELFDEHNITTVEPTFESNEYTWGSLIKVDVKFKDVWCNEYSSGELINSYSLNIITN